MNKIILSLAALAALSTAALADRTDIDPRDRDLNSGYSVQIQDTAPLYVGSSATGKAGLTAYERTLQQSMENENSGN